MLEVWYHPSWSGDFRLEAASDAACTLTVVDPTPDEQLRLGEFLDKVRKKGWLSKLAGIAEKGETRLELGVSVAEAGKVLLKRGERPRTGLLTAVRFAGGQIEADTDAGQVAAVDAKAAATVRRPTLCCPDPVPGPDRRASEVLRAFCTRRQWESWERDGFLVARGQLSGHRYRVAHRHSGLARRQSKVAWDLDDRHVVHCYDWAVPPAEEALAIKLVLEHAEPWIRNCSGYFDGPGPHYDNPFMGSGYQAEDGLLDAAAVCALGEGLVGWQIGQAVREVLQG